MDVDKNLDGVCATKNCDNPINLNAKICVHCLKEKYNKILEGKSREYEEWPNPPKNNDFNFTFESLGNIVAWIVIFSLMVAIFFYDDESDLGNDIFVYAFALFLIGFSILFLSGIVLFSFQILQNNSTEKKGPQPTLMQNLDFVGPNNYQRIDYDLLKKEKQAKVVCRVCNKSIESKSTIERIAKGTAGIGGGTYLGMIVGTIILPGFGTLIGGALGAIQGSELGSQVNDICDNCCMLCEKKKINCTCNDIIGSCRGCSANITRFNSSSGYCSLCYDHGEDI